jgi:hypothetical protein
LNRNGEDDCVGERRCGEELSSDIVCASRSVAWCINLSERVCIRQSKRRSGIESTATDEEGYRNALKRGKMHSRDVDDDSVDRKKI